MARDEDIGICGIYWDSGKRVVLPTEELINHMKEVHNLEPKQIKEIASIEVRKTRGEGEDGLEIKESVAREITTEINN